MVIRGFVRAMKGGVDLDYPDLMLPEVDGLPFAGRSVREEYADHWRFLPRRMISIRSADWVLRG